MQVRLLTGLQLGMEGEGQREQALGEAGAKCRAAGGVGEGEEGWGSFSLNLAFTSVPKSLPHTFTLSFAQGLCAMGHLQSPQGTPQ